ncbi:putative NlpC/P60 family cell wall peptidase [Caulobacter phage CcrRogue]|uniref:NLP/P60 family protein n=2 Tax=Poindextervirus TaxID=2733154 RepID=A0A385E987_9CAUD|nr:putative NlpC/P60 family cell wall peptidase [Caulobacter phage CcrRogue]YP_009808926.1 NLP/P60 family protein [Caulobacter phage CcrBL10]AFU86579.1 putative NlpC/P60 family cell wall peptidase [Caulobacter phage CcrRogue]AXQ68296.1 NLP/P60 family protein [Caulobacter phage CcrBL10]
MTRDDIVTEARRYVALQTPWRHRGRTERGLDCIGLAVMIFEKYNLEYMDQDGYARTPDGERFVDVIKAHMTLADPTDLKPGMLVLFNDDARPCHVGILAQKHGVMTLIHATADKKRTVEEIYDRRYAARFRMAFDFPGVED